MREINLPISIEVENSKVVAIWYVDDYGQDSLLSEEDYFVSYRTVPKQQVHPSTPKEPINWLQPKLWRPKRKRGNK